MALEEKTFFMVRLISGIYKCSNAEIFIQAHAILQR